MNENYKSEAIDILQFLNKKANRNFKPVDATIKPILARLKEGYSVKEIKTVIGYKCLIDTFYMANPKFMNPQTLMRVSKFPIFLEEAESYMNGKDMNGKN